jgi:hypothetical protein
VIISQVLLKKGVEESKILFLTLIAAPEGIHRVCGTFPQVKIITSEIDQGIGENFEVIPGKQPPPPPPPPSCRFFSKTKPFSEEVLCVS